MSVTASVTSPASAHFEVITCTVPRPLLIPPDYLNEAVPAILPYVRAEARKHHIKAKMILQVELMKKDKGELAIFEPFFLRSKVEEIFNVYEVYRDLQQQSLVLIKRYDDLLTRDSGWSFSRILSCECQVFPIKHAVGGDFIPTPPRIHAVKTVINIDNSEIHKGMCIYLCILCSELPPKTTNRNRANLYTQKLANDQRFKDVKPYVSIADLPALEVEFGKSIFVFKPNENPEQCCIEQVYRTNNPKGTPIDLLLLEGDNDTYHFAYIQHINKLFYGVTKHKGAKWFCRNCSMLMKSEEALNAHTKVCYTDERRIINFPAEQTTKKFVSQFKSLPIPYALAADFECALIELPEPLDDRKTVKTHRHQAMSYCIYRMCYIPEEDDHIPIIRRADNEKELFEMFAADLIKQKKWIENKLLKCEPMKLTKEEQASFEFAVKKHFPCHICGEPIGKKKLGSKGKDTDLEHRGVRDHCHVTGKYRGPAHQSCNWKFSYVKVLTSEMTTATDDTPARHIYQPLIPLFMHNAKGYDSHLVLKNFSKAFVGMKMSCIPNNMQKFMSVSFDNIRMLDSWAFLMASLDSCVETLGKKDTTRFFHTNRFYKKYTEKQRSLVHKKGSFPYEYITHPSKLNDNSLPTIEHWYSSLKDADISSEDYARAQQIWKAFDMKTLGDYHDFYLRNDVLQLADVMQEFRNISMKTYNLDPLHYYTSPGLAGDAMYKVTKGEVEIFGGEGAEEKYTFFENALRGGICGPSKREARANNPHVPGYDPTKPTTYIKYLDMNALYSGAMCAPLPKDGFSFIQEDDTELTKLFTPKAIMDIKDDSPIGYHLEVKLEYPEDIHALHNDYPLCQELIKLPGDTARKLVSTLATKKYFTCHYTYLKCVLKYGMKLTKVHRVMQYNQSPWMAPFINMNIDLRIASIADGDEWGKILFKLWNNANYGKQLETKRGHVDIKLATTHQESIKYFSSARFQGVTCDYTEDLTAIELDKSCIKLDNPIFLGQTILDISKVHMADFHYGFIKAKYGSKAELLYTDTDSLIYLIETEDINADMLANKERFDLSNQKYRNGKEWIYSSCYSPENEGKLRMMKDETPNMYISRLIALRPKMYAYETVNPLTGEIKDKKVVKGVRKPAIARMGIADFEEQKNRGPKGEPQYTDNVSIRSYDHQLCTQVVNKIALSANDNKRVILPDGIHTRAYGHYLN